MVGGKLHTPVALPLERDPLLIVQEAGWALEPVWMGPKKSRPGRDSNPGPSSCDDSLYRLRDVGHPSQLIRKDKIEIVKHSISKHFLKILPDSRNSDCSLPKVRGEFFTPKQIKISYNVFPEMSGF